MTLLPSGGIDQTYRKDSDDPIRTSSMIEMARTQLICLQDNRKISEVGQGTWEELNEKRPRQRRQKGPKGPKRRYVRKGHWEMDQNAKYYLFLIRHLQYFSSPQLRRAEKIFKEMSSFVGSRTPNQCRSHHQKQQKKYLKLDTLLESLYLLSKDHFLLASQPPFSRHDPKYLPYFRSSSEKGCPQQKRQMGLQLPPKIQRQSPLAFYEMPQGLQPISEKTYKELFQSNPRTVD